MVREPDVKANAYRGAWYLGVSERSGLRRLADAGDLRPAVRDTGHVVGEVEAPVGQFSPDGLWFAFQKRVGGERQLWVANIRSGDVKALTAGHDIKSFHWTGEHGLIVAEQGQARQTLENVAQARERGGYNYDRDLHTFSDLMAPLVPVPDVQGRTFIEVDAESGRLAKVEGRTSVATAAISISSTHKPGPILKVQAISEKGDPFGNNAVVTMELRSGDLRQCDAPECRGLIVNTWIAPTGDSITYQRRSGINDHVTEFYRWVYNERTPKLIHRDHDNDFRDCQITFKSDLICVKESAVDPSSLVRLSSSGTVSSFASINPEFASLQFGKVERIEWATPSFAWNEKGGAMPGTYPKKAYGYIYYPLGFNPSKKYPLFVDPYLANGFHSFGREHPLHVYAARNIVVLRSAFPTSDSMTRFGPDMMRMEYSQELGFPRLSMLAGSTMAAIDAVVSRGFIDKSRIGIGGVSHGTFVPLYMMQHNDVFAAVSISSPTWGPHEYFWGTKAGRAASVAVFDKTGYNDWRRRPIGDGASFWSAFDIADHTVEIEAPVLMNLAASETYALVRLIRNMEADERPYDAYVYAGEAHIKWQPAHLKSVLDRNLAWFLFWLKDEVDVPGIDKDTYPAWIKLREQQCKNPRSVNGFCKSHGQ
jgi:hypothetical protein